MSATVAARKRRKPASGVGAGKRPLKVRMALPWAVVCLVTGTAAIPSEESEPGPLSCSGDSFVPVSARQILKSFALDQGQEPSPFAVLDSQRTRGAPGQCWGGRDQTKERIT